MLPLEPQAPYGKAAEPGPVTTVVPATPGAAPAANAPPRVGALAQALRRCWRRALMLSLAAALAVGGVLLALPPQFSAVVLLHVRSRPPRGDGEPDLVNFQSTQSALVRSRSVLHAALEKPEVAGLREVRAHDDPVGWLRKSLVTDDTLGPEVLRLTLNGDNAEERPLLLNEVARAYLAEADRKEEARVGAPIKQLQENYRRTAEALRRKRLKLRARELELGVEGPETVKDRQGNATSRFAAARGPDKPQAELGALRDDIAQTELVLKRVADELAGLQAQSPVTPRVTLLEGAAAPPKKMMDRQVELAGVAGAGLFACVLVGVALRETRTRRVYATEDVAGGLALGVVGTLPALPAAARHAGPAPGWAAQGAMTEAIDAIRTVLLRSPRGEAPRVIV